MGSVCLSRAGTLAGLWSCDGHRLKAGTATSRSSAAVHWRATHRPTPVAPRSVIVPVVSVRSVPMSVMHIVDVVAVRHGHVPAALVVLVRMLAMRFVPVLRALVRLLAHGPMEMTVVCVVDVSLMSEGHMTASFAVRVVSMFVRRSHVVPFMCRG